ncbi:MAG: efflux RND transporter periplasmic adaptor subunit [Alphaproteobacteria bacterium]|nr:efflux RND transporter periplasmic adaptor subunit [Alphaproteobacteria bacterium]
MKKYMKWFVAALVFAALVFYFFQGNENKAELVTSEARLGKIRQTVTASGVINPLSTVTIGTQVSGTVKEIYVDYNSQVHEGQLLALIDPDVFEATVAQREAALEIAKAQVDVQENDIIYYEKALNRIKKLKDSKYSTDKELEAAQRNFDNAVAQLKLQKAQVKQAEAALKSAQTELKYTKITSPVDGIVISKSVEVGQTVAASFSTPELFSVAEDLSQMEIEASVVEADIAKVAVGQPVHFSVDSFPNDTFLGTVKQVRNKALTTSNVVTYSVIIAIDNSDLKLKPGMTANVEIITAQKENALLVPNAALRFYMDDNKRYQEKGIWVLKKGKPQRIAIKEGISDDENTEIMSDEISTGDKVIVAKKGAGNKNMGMRLRMPR